MSKISDTAPVLLESKSALILYPLILLHQVLAAISFPIFKLGLNDLEPFAFAFFRFTLTSAVYLPILFFLRKNKPMPRRVHRRLFLIGTIIILFNQTAYLYGQSLTSAGHSALLFATTPIFLYILAILFLNEKVTIRRTFGIAVAAVGVYIILSAGGATFGTEYIIGDLIILSAVMAWSVAAVLMKPLAVEYGAFRTTGTALVYGSMVYLPFGLYRGFTADYSGTTITTWLSILYVGIVVSIITYVLWYWLLKYMEASRLAIAQNLQPIIASGLAAVMLNEPITTYFIIGGIIVIIGVLVTEVKSF